jgi:hypothetical protein
MFLELSHLELVREVPTSNLVSIATYALEMMANLVES